MFVIQLKNKRDKILGKKYNDTKNWRGSKINLRNCGDSNTRICTSGLTHSEAADEKGGRNQQNKRSALTGTGQKMKDLKLRILKNA